MTQTHPGITRAGALSAVLLLAGGCSMFDSIPRGAESVTEIFRGPSPTEAADMALDPYDPDRRFRGIQLLANSDFGGQEPYVALYIDGLDDQDAGVRWASVAAIGRHGDPEHVELIVDHLTDPDVGVRTEAARALQRLHNDIAVPALMAATDPANESEPAVRAEAANALGQYAEQRVVQALIARLSDPSLSVNHNTLESLQTLTGQNFGLDQRAWVAWVDETEDVFAARKPYTYPVFARDKTIVEWLPFVPEPPNEAESTPVGMIPDIGS